MNIAVLGGSFDPPHVGHYLVAKQILEFRPDIEKVILMPSFKHQWKKTFCSARERVEMLQSFLERNIEISDIELKREGVSYTIDTIKEVKDKTGASVYWIIGSDILSEFDRWEKTDDMLKLAKFIVFPRDPYHLPENIPQGFEVIQDKNLVTTNISSTVIRQRIKEGKSIKYLVPEKVEEYILNNKLYK